MQRDEQTAAVATAGLVMAAVGAFLPWARIGGRPRSGFATADTFIGLADGALPDAIAWIGRWWYAPALLALVAWALVFLAGTAITRYGGLLLVTLAAAMWWLFLWAANHWNVLDVRLIGPVVTTTGLALIAWSTTRRRASLLAPKAGSESGSADVT